MPQGAAERSYVGMQKQFLVGALAVVTLALPATAETYTYHCGHDRVVLDDVANTITWNSQVFTGAHPIEGCKAAYEATDKAGAVATLCMATKGVASLDISAPKRHFECQMKR